MTSNSDIANETNTPPRAPAESAPLGHQVQLPRSEFSRQSLPNRNVSLSGEVEAYDSSLIDFATPSAIAILFGSEYNQSYPDTKMLDPDKLKQNLERGSFSSFLIRDPICAARVLAHAAIIPGDNNCLEIGKIVVSKESRNQGLGATVTGAALQAARARNPDLITAWAFTAHTNSQKIFERFGFTPIGISVRDWPDIFGVGSRESAVVLADRDTAKYRGKRKVYAPEFLQPALQTVYESLGCHREFERARAISQPPRFALPLIDRASLSTLGNIGVSIPAGSSPSAVGRAVDALSAEDPKHIGVTINLTSDDSRKVIEALYARGFYFSHILPTAEGDMLTLQRPEGGIETARRYIKLHSRAAADLFTCIERHAK